MKLRGHGARLIIRRRGRQFAVADLQVDDGPRGGVRYLPESERTRNGFLVTADVVVDMWMDDVVKLQDLVLKC